MLSSTSLPLRWHNKRKVKTRNLGYYSNDAVRLSSQVKELIDNGNQFKLKLDLIIKEN